MSFHRAQKAHLKEPSHRSLKRALGLYASSATERLVSLFHVAIRSFPSRFPPSLYKPGSADAGYGEGWERAGRCPDLRPLPEVLLPRPRLPHCPQTEVISPSLCLCPSLPSRNPSPHLSFPYVSGFDRSDQESKTCDASLVDRFCYLETCGGILRFESNF